MNSVNRAQIGEGGIGGAIHEAAWPGLFDECQKLNGCETSECEVFLGYKLPAKYVSHILRLQDKNDYKLSNFYKTCVQKVLMEDVRRCL